MAKPKPKVPTVPIPAPLYDAALRFCNAHRQEAGRKPWKRLPAGKPCDATECPCAQAVPGLCVGFRVWWLELPGGRPSPTADLPDDVRGFVNLFDSASRQAGGGRSSPDLALLPVRTLDTP